VADTARGDIDVGSILEFRPKETETEASAPEC
jgi:hypothetical protein